MVAAVRSRWASRTGSPVPLRQAPVSVVLALVTVALAVAHCVRSRHWHRVLSAATLYRGTDLEHGILWRLPLSAFLVHSPADLLWSVTLMLTLFAWVERRVGHAGLLIIAMGGHLASTLVIDSLAYDEHWHAWLTVRDFGTSCLVMAVLAAAIVATRHPALIVGLVVIFAVDVTTNSPMTIAEHLVALATGASVYAVIGWVAFLRRTPAALARVEIARWFPRVGDETRS